MKKLVPFAKALADETRCRVVHLVLDEALCVCEMAEALRLPQSTLSTHLAVIQRAELLQCERRGKWLFYQVSKEHRALVRSLFKKMEVAEDAVPELKKDRARAMACMGRRGENCCPP